MAEFGVGFRLSANTENFSAGMREAGESAKGLKRTLSDTFGENSLLSKLSIAGFTTLFVRGILSAADAAQEMRDKAIEMGRAVEDGVASAARFGDTVDSIKKGFTEAGVSVLSFFTRAGEGWGEIISRSLDYFGILKRGTGENEATLKAAIEQEKQLAKVRAEYGPEQLRAAEKALAEQRKKNLEESVSGEEKINSLLNQQYDLQTKIDGMKDGTVAKIKAQTEFEKINGELQKERGKIAEQNDKKREAAAEAEQKQLEANVEARNKINELKFNALPVEQQIVELEKQNAAWAETVAWQKKNGIDASEAELALLEGQNKLTEKRAQLTKQVAADVTAQVDKEAERIKKLVADANAWLGGMGSVRGGAQFNDMTDEALRSIVQRNRQGAVDAINSGSYGALTGNANAMEAARLQTEADNAQRILDSRNQLRTNVKLLGVEGARGQFAGDPAQFDSLVQRWVTDTRTQAEIARDTNGLLADVNQRLLKAGFAK